MPKNAAHGRIVWHELATTDSTAAKSFYPQITPEMQAGGAPPHWLPFVCVYDADACVRQAESLGGRVRSAPKEVTHVGCWAVISDPFGAPIGVFEPVDKPPGHDGDPRIGEF